MTMPRILPVRAITVLGLATLSLPLPAALVWSAGFESYDTSGGAVALTVNSTGNDDTFTAANPNASLTATAREIRRAGVPSFMSGNALYIGGESTAANISFALQQSAIASVGSSGVLVTSFDLYNTSPSIVSVPGEARTASGRSGSTFYGSNTPAGTAVRVTLVINKTGSAVTLPGTLGSLATDSAAIYRFDGTSYGGFSTSTSIGNTVTGFATGFSLSSSVVGSSYGLWLDNFGAWDDLADTVNGTSVLALAPGALSTIPEPAATAALLGLIGLGGVCGRLCARRASSAP